MKLMSSCVAKILFKSDQLCCCYCKMFSGLTFLGHTVINKVSLVLLDVRRTRRACMKCEPGHNIYGAVDRITMKWRSETAAWINVNVQ